ncbi:hypothetical protein HZC08_01415 [Candidatus Micrarchaeota archaeon]|nr:hypothetical protein [Candidatus Micrarchaeota archaeon]
MLKRFLLFTLLALSISFSQWDKFCSQSLLNCSIFPLTALITVILLAFIHLLGSAIQSPQLEGWVKVEIRELILAFILALILVGLAVGTSGFSFILTGEADLQKNANTKLTSLVDNLKPAYESLIKTSHYMGVLSGYSFVYPVPLWYASYTYMSAPYSGVSSILYCLGLPGLPIHQAVGEHPNRALDRGYNTLPILNSAHVHVPRNCTLLLRCITRSCNLRF